MLHYDLAWNPTRHEQREGRVDRFGQVKPEIKVVTYYGVDNQIDGLVLKVLIAKHETIRKDLGISIPVPTSSNAVLEALCEGLLLKRRDTQQLLLFEDDDLKQKVDALDTEWKSRRGPREAVPRPSSPSIASMTRRCAEEVEAIRSAIGSATDVEQFVTTALRGYGGTATRRRNALLLDFRETPASIREAAGGKDEHRARFELPVSDGEVYLSRTHPLVEGLASFVMESALDPVQAGDRRRPMASRCGVIRTRAVETRTTLLLVRFRYHILTTIDDVTRPLLAEDCQIVAFSGARTSRPGLRVRWPRDCFRREPDENVSDDVARTFVRRVLENLGPVQGRLDVLAYERGKELLAAHRRVRQASQRTGCEGNHRASTTRRPSRPLRLPARGLRAGLAKIQDCSRSGSCANPRAKPVHDRPDLRLALAGGPARRIVDGDPGLPGLTPDSYHLNAGERLNEAAARAWNTCVGNWKAFREASGKLPASDQGTTLTQGQMALAAVPRAGLRLASGEQAKPGDRWQGLPAQPPVAEPHPHSSRLVQARDRPPAPGATGAAQRSPYSLVQEFLNRSAQHRWGFASNGHKLVLLHDNLSLARASNVEFDLEAMFEGEVYSDFFLLFLLCHQSRVEILAEDRPEECWLERWSKLAEDQGTRAQEKLRDGVEKAINALGAGFLTGRGNTSLKDFVRNDDPRQSLFYRELLRLVYRLILLLVAEDKRLREDQ